MLYLSMNIILQRHKREFEEENVIEDSYTTRQNNVRTRIKECICGQIHKNGVGSYKAHDRYKRGVKPMQ